MGQKVIVNADDFGMSKGINYGVMEAYLNGIISSTLLMPNLDAAEHAVNISRVACPELSIGQHTNFLLGKPCSDPAKIPSMVDVDGNFHRSAYYRSGQGHFVYDEVRRETIAQMERFRELLGYYPEHIDCHAVGDETVDQAFYDIALEYGIHTTLKYSGDKVWPSLPGYLETGLLLEVNGLPFIEAGTHVEHFLRDDFALLKQDTSKVIEMHFDAGFLDQFVLDNSSMTTPRCRELETLCDPRVRAWFDAHDLERISFADLKRK
ncbi:ChbG/HpnK family deacetylase [Listeria booriae]|uniref:ChbG/HpnK family deacetylase n=1 Tax=Listeria booriae TaxID=1552123 RepID=A0A7X0XCP7_9LIST|nr:ChbG/HpnK family deacetylase [Listeria booriae]MBC1491276.1 ChbG/HpnK family deacetylase [Listeria booriae]MBC2256872.1 ChbG/HpnK family deacetylase [Listeria booriae]